jgi:SAM-dependent methyltransferase
MPQMLIASPAVYEDATEFEVMSRLLPFEGAHVLELGCGSARWTRTIAEKFNIASLRATEVDKVQHAKNQQIDDLPKVEFCYGGAQDIQLPDASVDIVIMLKSLHHVPVDLMHQSLGEIHRVLRSGGLAYISEPVYAGEFNQILRLFNDEKEVRQAAFDSLRDAVDVGMFDLAEEVFFQGPSSFTDFADFEQRILFPSHSDHRIDPDLHQRVKAAFLPHLTAKGAEFINPQRVDLLRKP